MATETELISYPEPAPEQAHEMCESIMSGESAGFFRKDKFPSLYHALHVLFGRLDVGMVLIREEKIKLGARATAVEYTRLMNIKTFLEQLIRLPSVPKQIHDRANSCLQKCSSLLFKRHEVGIPPSAELGAGDEDNEGVVLAAFDDRNTKPTIE